MMEVIVLDGVFEAVDQVTVGQKQSGGVRTMGGVEVVEPNLLEFAAVTTFCPEADESYDTVHVSVEDDLYCFSDVLVTEYTQEINDVWNSVEFTAASMFIRKL